MSAVDNLPGLVAQEYRSLNVIIGVYFMMYYEAQNNGDQDPKVAKVLFELSSRVLKDYVLKQSEIFAIRMSKKQREKKKSASSEDLPEDDEGAGIGQRDASISGDDNPK